MDRKLQSMTVMAFHDTPSEKCAVYSVSLGPMKILRMSWEQDRCKNESERERHRERGREKE